MAQYSYDETGQYNFFLITFLTFLLLPWTYFALRPGGSDRATAKVKVPCEGWNVKDESVRKGRKRTSGLKKSHALLALGWLAFAYVLQNALLYESATPFYDPFQVLGIDSSLSEKDIKRHYRKLSLKYHPDKLRDADNKTLEEANSHYIELTKAYKALTDEEIRNNYEQYGHPDGKQEFSMGIALPSWIVESRNNGYVLGVYGLLFGVLLPLFVGRWWYGSKRVTKDGVLTTTAGLFFREIKEEVTFPEMLQILAAADEFTDKAPGGRLIKHKKEVDKLEKKVKEAMRELTSEKLEGELLKKPQAKRTAVLLYAHLLRVPIESRGLLQDKNAVVEKANSLCLSMMNICLSHNWLGAYLTAISLQQHIVQAFHPSLSPLLQLPGVSVTDAEKLAKAGLTNPTTFVKCGDEAQQERKAILQDNGEKAYTHAVKIAENWPTLEVVDAKFKVVGEDIITPGSFVQLVMKVRVRPPSHVAPPTLQVNGSTEELTAVEKGEETDLDELIGRKKAGQMGETPDAFAHTPYYPGNRKPSWSVFVGDHKLGRVFVQPVRFASFGYNKIRTIQITFQAPPGAGLYTFQTYVKSDSFVGADAQKDMMMQVQQPEAAPAAGQEIEDDISEPDEDTIAGQMAAMRGQPFKAIDGDGAEEDGEEEEESDASSSDDDSDSSDSSSDSDSD